MEIKEYKRKCKECGKIWHSLESREKQIEKDRSIVSLNQATVCFTCNQGAGLQAQKNVASYKDSLEKLRSCPKCGSHNYYEELKSYNEKK